MKLTSETKVFLGIIIVTLFIVAGGIFFFSQPTPVYTKENLIPSGTYTTGNKEAKVFLVEFSDFQCPACKAYQPAMKELLNKNKDKLFFAYRHFPLDQHPFSKHAALAAEAAGAQGKFWEMHDALFENQDNFTESYFPELAKQLTLDPDAFTKSLADNTLKDKIAKDRVNGEKIGVDSTPTFFLQGKKLTLLTPSDLSKEVEAAIAAN